MPIRKRALPTAVHNVQVAAMLGVAMALKDTGLMAELDGDVAFMAFG